MHGYSLSSPVSSLLLEQHGATLVLTINRPDVRNAIDSPTATAIGQALEWADESPEIRSVVITGAQDRAFCAGTDLKALAGGPEANDPDERAWGFGGIAQHAISTPTIAAVNGLAFGGGAEIALACDMIVASSTATFALPEVQRGVYPGGGGAFRLPRQIPEKVALEMMLTGNPITAERAYELGLVNRVVSPGELIDEALALAARVNANAPLAVQATKRIARGIRNRSYSDEGHQWAHSQVEGEALAETDDFLEGPRAFSEKRSPVWVGK